MARSIPYQCNEHVSTVFDWLTQVTSDDNLTFFAWFVRPKTKCRVAAHVESVFASGSDFSIDVDVYPALIVLTGYCHGEVGDAGFEPDMIDEQHLILVCSSLTLTPTNTGQKEETDTNTATLCNGHFDFVQF